MKKEFIVVVVLLVLFISVSFVLGINHNVISNDDIIPRLEENYFYQDTLLEENGYYQNARYPLDPENPFDLRISPRERISEPEFDGYIIEFEKMYSEEEKEKTLDLLKEKFKILNIPITSKEEFNKKFKYYKDNWRELTK